MMMRRVQVAAPALMEQDVIVEVIDSGSSIRFIVDRVVPESAEGKLRAVEAALQMNMRPIATINEIKDILGMTPDA